MRIRVILMIRINLIVSVGKALGSCKMPVSDLFELVGHVINFIWSEIFNGNYEVREDKLFFTIHTIFICFLILTFL